MTEPRRCRVYNADPCISECLIGCRRLYEEDRAIEDAQDDVGTLREGWRQYWREWNERNGR